MPPFHSQLLPLHRRSHFSLIERTVARFPPHHFHLHLFSIRTANICVHVNGSLSSAFPPHAPFHVSTERTPNTRARSLSDCAYFRYTVIRFRIVYYLHLTAYSIYLLNSSHVIICLSASYVVSSDPASLNRQLRRLRAHGLLGSHDRVILI